MTADDIIFVAKLVKSIKKLKKSKHKTSKKVAKHVSEILVGVESHFNIHLNVEEGMKEVKQLMKDNDLHSLLKDVGHITKILKKALKKERGKARCCPIEFSNEEHEEELYIEENLLYSLDFQGIDYALDARGKGKDDESKKMPVALTVSVTATLVGVFLAMLPIPQVQAMGGALIGWGLGKSADIICQALDEKEEEKGDSTATQEKRCLFKT